ncbi:PAK-box/P21-Rho-binding [Artemisia annua]|uniref:PAK-box/P21-Rho-binding n=1 Tax=Artemisia annua TaxID=35608 RepID=A0A2U1L3X6_ARTAN|nr:PAK-box/P21-Rho-binding [Artemisia annua]
MKQYINNILVSRKDPNLSLHLITLFQWIFPIVYMEKNVLLFSYLFQCNGKWSKEDVRKQLNRGFFPQGVDIHCLAGLIKARFRELPSAVLDSLTPEHVIHCNTEDECTRLANYLPPTEAALLDGAINLMADVVKHDQQNKMNARNIVMVFASNMTQITTCNGFYCDRFTPNSKNKPPIKNKR